MNIEPKEPMSDERLDELYNFAASGELPKHCEGLIRDALNELRFFRANFATGNLNPIPLTPTEREHGLILALREAREALKPFADAIDKSDMDAPKGFRLNSDSQLSWVVNTSWAQCLFWIPIKAYRAASGVYKSLEMEGAE